MKRIVFSGVTKFIAVILFAACITLGALTAAEGILAIFEEETILYSFESSFSESKYLAYLLDEPEGVVSSVYYNTFDSYDDYGRPIETEKNFEEQVEVIEEALRERFRHFYHSDKVNYYVQWNDLILTNCDAESPEDLMKGDYYSYVKRDADGSVERTAAYQWNGYAIEDLFLFDNSSTITVCCSLKPELADSYKAAWEKQEILVLGTIGKTAIYAAGALLLLIYLLCVCGKNKDGEFKTLWIDKVWAEVHLAVMAGLGVGGVALCVFAMDEYMYGQFPEKLLEPLIISIAALVSLGVITSLLSLIRRTKNGTLLKTSLVGMILRVVYRVLKCCFELLRLTAKWIGRKTVSFWSCIFSLLSRTSGVLLITFLFMYTAMIGTFGLLLPNGPVYLILWILAFVGAAFLLAHRAKALDEIKKGVSNVRNGNTSYKIPELKCEDLKLLAANINDIAIGLDESVNARLKAERMKTELITNVSHDLKTPITSIINYTELLSKMDDLPEEGRDYVSVIAKKSERLKNLTEDLFDISKVQSGNEQIVLERLDTALLISQSLGEYDNEIGQSGLTFCVDAPKELCITADGRKMSRVVGNLISNILKYAMKNTRVFITAAETDGEVVMEFKNVSAYPLDFDVDEIVQRFVRGDESRTSEGNGLGLAIAKSYTEICGGRFEITTDGDLFKVRLRFGKYS